MAILIVGVSQHFSTISAAVAASRDGDTVQVQAGTYVNDFAAVNTKITIQGVGGMAHLVATIPPPDGKAILTTNTDITLDHLEFSGAAVADRNGAGVRYQGGNLTVTNSYFHDNENGILGNASPTGTVTIRNSEFSHNGEGSGSTHNIYIGDIASLTIDSSYFHDAVVGHEIKSRAENTTITNSRIQDGATGTASYSIDAPNGGNVLIQGNVIQQGPASQNPAIIAFGEEGNVHANSTLKVLGNTILNDLQSPSLAAVWNATGAQATATNNSFYGVPAVQITRGSVTVSGSTVLATEPALVTTSPWAAAASTPASIPVPTPAPVPALVFTPAPTPTPAATDSLVVRLSEDAYQGDAQFTVSVDGQRLGAAQSVTAQHGAGSQAFNFAPSLTPGTHQVSIAFVNDLWNPGVGDRNLYVEGITLGGVAVPVSNGALYSNGSVTAAVTKPSTTATVPTPTPVSTPITSDTLVLNLSEDAFQGDAQFTVSVDGKSLGAAQTVTALHGAGASQAFAFNGQFGPGAHDLAVTFINDNWNPGVGDRNLYVNGATLNGTASASTGSVTLLDGTHAAHVMIGTSSV